LIERPRVLADVADAQLVLVGLGDDTRRLRTRRLEARRGARFFHWVRAAPVARAVVRADGVPRAAEPRRGFSLVYLKRGASPRPSDRFTCRAGDRRRSDQRLVDQDDLDSLAGAVWDS
jgi:hypothetical protein